MSSTPEDLAASTRELALAALQEITPAATVGPYADYRAEADGVVSLRFQNRLAGYPGWYWTVTVAQVDEAEPTVLEAELMPGDGALLAPDWVPWAERLAEYRAHQAELAEAAAEAGDADEAELDTDDSTEDADEGEPDDDDSEEDSEEDDSDDDADAALSDLLHAGDLDGVDIDELDPAAQADTDADDSDDDGSDDDDDSDDDDSDDDDVSDDEE